ncbi:hypothetical protein TKK_0006352 [Trichogramma kaykai]
MKRSSSGLDLQTNDSKRPKVIENDENSPNINHFDYCLLALERIEELQKQIYDDYDSDDDLENFDDNDDDDEDVTKEVLTDVFGDLPGNSKNPLTTLMGSTSKFDPPKEFKPGELLGFEYCRIVTANFLKNIDSPIFADSGTSHLDPTHKYDGEVVDFDARAQTIRALDLHLAIKQRDYAAHLMAE